MMECQTMSRKNIPQSRPIGWAEMSDAKRTAWNEEFDRFALYDPGEEKRKKFHASDHRRRVLQCPNQVGKSRSTTWEDWAYLLGYSPYKDLSYLNPKKNGGRKTVGLIMISNATNKRAVCRNLWETCPVWLVDWSKGATEYVESRQEWVGNRILMRNGNQAFIVWSTANSTTIAGETCNWQHIDEPPREKTLDEFVARGFRQLAPLWLSFTPIAEYDLTWLKHRIYGDEERKIKPKEEWEVTRIHLSLEDCPFLVTMLGSRERAQESIDAQVNGISESERAQRVFGDFDGLNPNRTFSAFDDIEHIGDFDDEDFDMKIDECEVAIGADHGEKINHECALIILYDQSINRIHFAEEYANETTTTSAQDAQGIRECLSARGLEPEMVSLAVGDVNTAGKEGDGKSINDLISAELGINFVIPDKGPGSVVRDNKRFNDALSKGIITISPKCTRLLACMRYWEGAEDDHKHIRDAAIYPAMKLLNKMKMVMPRGSVKPRVDSKFISFDISTGRY